MIAVGIVFGFLGLLACLCIGILLGARGWNVGAKRSSWSEAFRLGLYSEWESRGKELEQVEIGIDLGLWIFALVFTKNPEQKKK